MILREFVLCVFIFFSILVLLSSSTYFLAPKLDTSLSCNVKESKIVQNKRNGLQAAFCPPCLCQTSQSNVNNALRRNNAIMFEWYPKLRNVSIIFLRLNFVPSHNPTRWRSCYSLICRLACRRTGEHSRWATQPTIRSTRRPAAAVTPESTPRRAASSPTTRYWHQSHAR